MSTRVKQLAIDQFNPLMCRCGHVRAAHVFARGSNGSEFRYRRNSPCMLHKCDCPTFSSPYYRATLDDLDRRLTAHERRLERIGERLDALIVSTDDLAEELQRV